MPGKVAVKIKSGRNLPVMDRSSDTTDAYVEIKLGTVTQKTDVFRKSLNPQWNTDWFRFEVDDAELQDEPLQIRLMDHDTYSANDAIGKVNISLNPLCLENSGQSTQGKGTVLSGWIPVFDTMHGIRGEVNVIVKVDLFSDLNKFRQSSCGIPFFHSQCIPFGYRAQVIHGFVEELVVNDDPEYAWIDKIRTPRASNEARQVVFLKLSGQVQRKMGLKAINMGANAVIGYTQCFDLEGDVGVVARGIGTAVTLIKDASSSQPVAADNALIEERTAKYLEFLTSAGVRDYAQSQMELHVYRSHPTMLYDLRRTRSELNNNDEDDEDEMAIMQELMRQEDERGEKPSKKLSHRMRNLTNSSRNLVNEKYSTFMRRISEHSTDSGHSAHSLNNTWGSSIKGGPTARSSQDVRKPNVKTKFKLSPNLSRPFLRKKFEKPIPSIVRSVSDDSSMPSDILSTIPTVITDCDSIAEFSDSTRSSPNISSVAQRQRFNESMATNKTSPRVNSSGHSHRHRHYPTLQQPFGQFSKHEPHLMPSPYSSMANSQNMLDDDSSNSTNSDDDVPEKSALALADSYVDKLADERAKIERMLQMCSINEEDSSAHKWIRPGQMESCDDSLPDLKERNTLLQDLRKFSKHLQNFIYKPKKLAQVSQNTPIHVINRRRSLPRTLPLKSLNAIDDGERKNYYSSQPELINTYDTSYLLRPRSRSLSYLSKLQSAMLENATNDNLQLLDTMPLLTTTASPPQQKQQPSQSRFPILQICPSTPTPSESEFSEDFCVANGSLHNLDLILGPFNSETSLETLRCPILSADSTPTPRRVERQIVPASPQLQRQPPPVQITLTNSSSFSDSSSSSRSRKLNNTNAINSSLLAPCAMLPHQNLSNSLICLNEQTLPNSPSSSSSLISLSQQQQQPTPQYQYQQMQTHRNQCHHQNAHSHHHNRSLVELTANNSGGGGGIGIGVGSGNAAVGIGGFNTSGITDSPCLKRHTSPAAAAIVASANAVANNSNLSGSRSKLSPSPSKMMITNGASSNNNNNNNSNIQNEVIIPTTVNEMCRRSSDSDLSVTPKGNSICVASERLVAATAMMRLSQPLTGKNANAGDNLDMLEYPFLTMTKYPPGFILHLGATVAARSVKLLERVPNPDEPEVRDSWWTELRMEIRSHARALCCNVVLGYSETTTISDDVCVLSATGTAAVINMGYNRSVSQNDIFTVSKTNVAAGISTSLEERDILKENMRTEAITKEPAMSSSFGAGSASGIPSVGPVGSASKKIGGSALNATRSACNVCHVPYSLTVIPFNMKMKKCAVCHKGRVPDVLLATLEVPEYLQVTGRGCFMQAQVVRAKKDLRSELNAKEISDGLPFLEYELHRLLINKLKAKGMNAIFGLKAQVSIGERMIALIATGTALFLSALPVPQVPKIVAGNSWTDKQKLNELQKKLQETYERNQEIYQLKSMDPDIVATSGNATGTTAIDRHSDTDDSDDEVLEMDLNCGSKDTCVLEVDDIEDLEIISLLMEPCPPEGFHVVNTQMVPGLTDIDAVKNLQMFTQVWRAKFDLGHNINSFPKHFQRLLQTIYFKLRTMIPCAICDLRFRLDLPESDQIQLLVTGMALGLGDTGKLKSQRRPKTVPVQTNGITEFNNSIVENTSSSTLTTMEASNPINIGGNKRALQEEDYIFPLDEDQMVDTPTPTSNVPPFGSFSLKLRKTSPSRATSKANATANIRNRYFPLRDRYGIDVTPLSFVPGGRIDKYLGNLNFFFIRESTSIRENGGISGFVHGFITELLAVVRGHIAALGGNAMVSFYMTELILFDNQHKNQGQCLISIGGDAVYVAYHTDD